MNTLPHSSLTAALPSSQTAYAPIDTHKIAASFGKAASAYDDEAQIQKVIARTALGYLPASLNGEGIDVGCGTGLHTEQLNRRGITMQGVDLAEGMVRFAQQQYPHIRFLQGHAQQLPLSAHTTDLVFSSMALQWCDSPFDAANECFRVLKSGGIAELAIMVDGSFIELHKARAIARLPAALTTLPCCELWLAAFQQAGFTVRRVITKVYTDEHPHILSLLRSIKNVGAGVTHHKSQQSLTKRDLSKLDIAYRNLASDKNHGDSLPLSYLVSHFRIEKP